MKKWPVIGFVLAILWLFVRGVTLDPNRILGEFLIGLAFGMLIAFMLRRFYTPETNVTRSVQALPYAGLYLVVFIKDLIMANLDADGHFSYDWFPHHNWSNPALYEDFAALDLRSVVGYRYIIDSICLSYQDGMVAERLKLRGVHEIPVR